MDETKRDFNFPCPVTGEYVSIPECQECRASVSCDIYATMLDEKFD